MNRLLWFKPRPILWSFFFVAALILSLYLGGCFAPQDPLTIAVSLGTDDPTEIGVDQAIKGIEEYIKEVNQAGGVNGKKLKIELFNDSNDPEKARQVAQDIADSNALIVLGHYYSSTSIAAGETYKKNGVPAITGGATADKVTKGNEWYFRTILNGSSQANFLAFYIKEVLGYANVSLIYDGGETFSNSMGQAFEKGAQEHQVKLENKWDLSATEGKDIEEKIQNIVGELAESSSENVGAVVILTIEDPAVKIIAAMKRQGLSYPIVGGDSLSAETFVKRFQEYPEEQKQPGYFTNGIYSISHILFDVLGEKAQDFKSRYTDKYDREPGWVTGTFYNSAKVAVAAIERAKVTGNPELIKQERQKVRDEIDAMEDSLATAVDGLNGPIYFNSEGNLSQSVTISYYLNSQIVSALRQLTPITIAKSKEELAADLSTGNIVRFGEQFLNRTHVVYAGIRPRNISELDLDKKTCKLDFDLWFRYSNPEELKNPQPIEDIDFLNAVNEIELGQPINKVEKDGAAYDLYKVSGTFNLDFLDQERDFGQHIIGVNFINNKVSQSHLLYVIDSIGLSPVDDKIFGDILRDDQVLSPETGWKIQRVKFFQDATEPETLGNPGLITSRREDAKFSRFNLAITIVHHQINFRRAISPVGSLYLLGSWLLLTCFFSLYKRRQKLKLSEPVLWGLKLASILILIYSTEIILLQIFKHLVPAEYLELIALIFDTLWWIVPAYFFGEALEFCFWKPLEKRTGYPVPTLVHRMVLTVIYLLTFFCVVAHVFDRPLTSLLATSGLALTIIGLAIQINISNIFSGLAINLEQTFKVGDYIELCDEDIRGYVADITWRATHIETISGNTVLIPNSAINDKTIINYMRPKQISRITIPFTLPQETSSDLVIATLKRAIAAIIEKSPKSLLAKPAPEVFVGGTDSLGVIYELKFWHLPTDANLEELKHLVVESVLQHFKEEKIELAVSDE